MKHKAKLKEFKVGDRVITKKRMDGKFITGTIHSIWFGAGDNMKLIPDGYSEPQYTCTVYWKHLNE